MEQTPNAGQYILSRGLPKTEQVTSYAAGDDGDYEAGWWRGRLNSNNKTRYLQKTIGGDDVVLDRATGLMWAADGNAAGCNNGNAIIWADTLIYAAGLTFAGFSDWRVPNCYELRSITELEAPVPGINLIIFPNTVVTAGPTDYYWSSTTQIDNAGNAFVTHFMTGRDTVGAKAMPLYLRCARKGI